MWDAREARFPEHTPVNKEYYLLRAIFEEHYPNPCAEATIPKGLSVACSTPEAICWDPAWANMHDISGRAVAAHEAAQSYSTAQEMAGAGSGATDVERGYKGAGKTHGNAEELTDGRVPRAPLERLLEADTHQPHGARCSAFPRLVRAVCACGPTTAVRAHCILHHEAFTSSGLWERWIEVAL
jgi:hypothetical protein